MAKNLGRKYATMSEDERRRFRVEESEGVADPEHRDGLSAQLDEEAHRRAVEDG
jgi:hypothetical protein